MNQTELEQICEELQTWVGAQLQEVISSENSVALGFYHAQKMNWLMFDFRGRAPVLLILDEGDIKRLDKKMKPLTLFMRAHFDGKRIAAIEIAKGQGRVLRIDFHSGSFIEAVLFAFAKNFTAHADSKQISLFKPKEFSPQLEKTEELLEARSFQSMKEEWLAAQMGVGKAKVSPLEKIQKLIDKKTQALEKMNADISEKSENKFKDAGEQLKVKQSLEISPELLAFINPQKTLSQNITEVFQKAKDQERKIKSAGERASLLRAEIAALKESLNHAPKSETPKAKNNFLQKIGAQARTLKVDEDLQAYIGKSAKDNLEILRKAQPFDLWLHLRDVPSAHVVVRKTKSRTVTDTELRKIGEWMINENFGAKAREKKGEVFDLIVCECRHVKPIKGDKLGRVHYQNDRTIRLKFI